MARVPVSGRQHTLRAGDLEAVVVSVGASLRSLTADGRDLVVPYGADEVRPGYRGATLAPWPNRVVDGRYSFGGADYRLPLTEPDRHHALHGLAAWLDYASTDERPGRVTLTGVIQPQTGYPWRITVETTFALTADGLTQTVRATNDSDSPAPWGTAPHPYLVGGAGSVGEWMLELPADDVLEVTPDRLIPTGLRPVDGDDPARFDYRTPRPIGDAAIDHAYTGLRRDADGLATVRVTDAAGRGVEMAWGSACPWVQIHTADRPGGASDPTHRIGLAVEPMTCAPDAFNPAPYDTGLLTIAPGATVEASWSIRPLR